MSQDKNKSIAAMRTFARDLDRERGHTDTSVDTPVSEKPAKHKRDTSHTAAAPKAVADAPTTTPPIPAFHELQKKVTPTVVVTTPTLQAPAVTVKKDKGGIVATKAVGGGTIITDTKIARAPFFTALATSLTTWFTGIKKQFKPKQKRTYAVTSTERRRGVVQKATSKTGAIFSADKAELQAIIRKRQLESTASSHEPELDWSPFTEPGFLLLEGEHDEIIEATHPLPSKPSSVAVIPKQSSKSSVFEPPAPAAPIVVTTPLPTSIPEPVAVKPLVTAPVAATPPAPVENEVVPEPYVAPEAVPEAEIEESESSPDVHFWSLNHLTHLSTNELSILVVGVLLIITIGGFVGFTIITPPANDGATPVEQTLTSITSLDVQSVVTVPIENAVSIMTKAAGTKRAVELVTVNSDGVVNESFLQQLISPDGESFLRASHAARLLVTATGDRVLLVPIADNVNARGGLLDWEGTMYRDLSPLLNYNVLPTLTNTYQDVPFNTLDTRQLRDGEIVVLVYGFVTDELVIVAPSLGAFAETVRVLNE